mmetsp:Transcript_78102/g.252834  ORF Transcript_78102/g.252834 Transcript_78102/m.252834 type:complete len:233 (+) Transcript_78102:638-1336(+)
MSCAGTSSLANRSQKPSPLRESMRSLRISRMVCSTWLLSQLLRQKESAVLPLRASSHRTNAVLRAKWSEAGKSLGRSSAQCTFLACARLLSEKGATSGERCESAAATVQTASVPPKSAAKSTIFPRRKSHGSRAKHWPMGVVTYQTSSLVPHWGAFAGLVPSSTAPVAFSVATAWSMRSFGGGSRASAKQLGWRPELSTESISSIKEQRRISGVGISWSRSSKRLRVRRWKL